MAGQVNVFGHYSYMLNMYSTEVGILQKAFQIIFSSLLQCLDAVHLKAKVMCPIPLHDLMHQVCKRLLTDEELSALLIPVYLMESYCPQLVPLGPLQPTLPELFMGGLPTYSGSDAAFLPSRSRVPPPLPSLPTSSSVRTLVTSLPSPSTSTASPSSAVLYMSEVYSLGVPPARDPSHS